MNDAEFIQSLADNEGVPSVWIGGTLATGKSGTFVWADKTKFDFENWNRNGKVPSGGGACIQMHEATWNDISCKTDLHYVCKKRSMGKYAKPTICLKLIYKLK